MAVNSSVALAIATLVFYVLVAPVAVLVAINHGVKRAGPWYFMLLLVLIRIIGEPMIIASNGQFSADNGVSIGGLILSTIGLSPLLLMAGGVIQEVNAALGEANSAINPRLVRLMQLVPLVALIISSVGSSNIYSSNPSTAAQGQTERVAATALYVVYFGLLVLAAASLYHARHQYQERRAHIFLAAAVTSFPFLLVRLIDTCITTFGSMQDQLANSNNIWIRAFMGSLMEFLVVIIFLVAGFMTEGKKKALQGSYEQTPGTSGQYETATLKPGQENGTSRV